MKKSLIALAVLAASGAAMAQSSVTLYGRLDVGLNITSNEVESANPALVQASNDQTKIDSSMMNSTFWGLKGSEDLGGGLKANFDLQAGFAVDTGSPAVGSTSLFERRAVVGLSGGFGAVNLGRQYTAYDTLRAATNNLQDANLATTNNVWKTGAPGYANRISNSIRYDSANYSGFRAAVSYGFGENDNLGTNLGDATDNLAVALVYAAGPLGLGVAYQQEKLAQTNAAINQDELKNLLFAGYYDFGMVKLTGGYNMAETDTRDDDEWQIGVSAPLGASADVAFGYSDVSSSGTGGDLDGQGWSMVGRYNMSKRTTLYAGYAYTEVESIASGSIKQTNDSNFALGVRHTF